MNKDLIKMEIECQRCRTKFLIWLSTDEFGPEIQEAIKTQFYRHCPVCKALEGMKKGG